jgi:hypothetical protein
MDRRIDELQSRQSNAGAAARVNGSADSLAVLEMTIGGSAERKILSAER